ncbi:orotidine-5'-phosphate decarboxylase [Atopococcus tabaci]|uniref:orotidine-5'-phosphate decarboxylase n=1 Tax=Atopococcus tabaci TaxID=269774 RepID=UPI000421D1CA|nr:orotidine-5'-phosphate decarboxylase [Atopococcus tabaci]
MTTQPIIALDVPSRSEARSFLKSFGDEELYLKVGMELFYAEGPELIRELKEMGHRIFLDLKLHDIPNTVYRAMRNIAALGIDMVNVHAAGGSEMMRAAKKGLEEGAEGASRPLLIAVTQLTSTTEDAMQREQRISLTLEESVLQYAKLAHESGLDGVVCSAWEAEAIQKATSPDFLCVTPGIRPDGSETGDQKRVATPERAREMGASYIVVGRPITQAAASVTAYHSIFDQWKGEQQ